MEITNIGPHFEVRQWKSQTLDRIFRSPMGWRHLHAVNAVFGRKAEQHPQLEGFANLLEDLFAGNPAEPMAKPVLTEQPISVEELSETVRPLKQGKASDDFGVVAALLHHAPPTFLNALLEVLNHLLRAGDGGKLAFKCCPRWLE